MGRRPLLPIETERLVIRMLDRRDVTRFTDYRNLPEVWRYQDWEVPFTRDHAHALIDGQERMRGPAPDEWVQLAIDDGRGIVGDLAVWLDRESALAMIGYTLAPEAQGKGYATEAARALVDRLFDRVGVHRVAATLDPANVSSSRVLERLGFRYEGRSVAAALVRGRWEDDDRYAVLRDEYRAWHDRTRRAPDRVALVPVTPDNVRGLTRLHVHHSQERFVASVAESFGDALVPEVVDGAPVVPWFRAVEADGELVGFVMIAERTEAHPVPFLWRLLVDRWHQGRGIGRRVVALVGQHVASLGATTMGTSWVDGSGGPARFYQGLGFRPTGRIIDGEVEAVVEVDLLPSP